MTLPPFPPRPADVELAVRMCVLAQFRPTTLSSEALSGDGVAVAAISMAKLAHDLGDMTGLNFSDVSPYPQSFDGWRDLICAKLDGRKTQTRRVITPRNTRFDGGRWPNYLSPDQLQWYRVWVEDGPSPAGNLGPYLKLPVINIEMIEGGTEETVHRIYPLAQPGDRLWVREAWRTWASVNHLAPRDLSRVETIQYEATGETDNRMTMSLPGRYRHARFMPRWASRLTLTVTDVRVQRVQDISEADAMAEGADYAAPNFGFSPISGQLHGVRTFKAGFAHIWDSIHGPGAWARNDWVAALTFKVERRNIGVAGK